MRDVLATLPHDSTAALGVRFPHLWGLHAHEAPGLPRLEERFNCAGRMSVLLLRDPASPGPMQATDASVTLETPSGRRKVSEEEYRAAVCNLRPSVAVSFHDEVALGAGHNRTRATVERAARWLRAALSPLGVTGDGGGAGAQAGQQPPPRKAARSDLAQTPLDAGAAAASGPGDAPRTSLLAYVPLVADADARGAAVRAVAAAVGAYLPDAADPAAAATSPVARPRVCGFYLGGLGLGESRETRRAVLAAALPLLPPSGVRVLAGPLTPLEMLEAVALGVDVFDSDYAGALTRAGCAAAFLYDPGAGGLEEGGAVAAQLPPGAAPFATRAAEPEAPAAPLEPAPSGLAALVASAPAGEGGGAGGGPGSQPPPVWLAADPTPVLNVRAGGAALALDSRPLVPGCGCFACAGLPEGRALPPAFATGRPAGNDAGARRPLRHAGHRRAYVHHLLQTQEMLGGVLLHAHNVYHVGEFLRGVRGAVAAGRLPAYVAWFERVNGLAGAPAEAAGAAAGRG